MKKCLLLMTVVLLVSNCKGEPKKYISKHIDTEANASEYPPEVLHLGVQRQYDKSKWLLYCIYSDATIHFKEKTKLSDSLKFGMLPLKFEGLELKGDTIEFNFGFYYNGVRLNSRNVKNIMIFGTVFKGYYEEPIYYHAPGDGGYFYWHCDDINNCPSRFGKPLQPEVVKYIKENKDKLDPWFRKEAIKRGVINE